MADLVCYRIRTSLDGEDIVAFDQVVRDDKGDLDVYGPEDYGQFTAMLYVRNTPDHALPWQAFVREGFGPDVRFPLMPGSSALVVVAIGEPRQFYALPFGVAGRYLLRDGVFERSFGLRAALNLLFSGDASTATAPAGRVQSVDTTLLGTTTMKARKQASRLSTLETFDVDRLREMLRQLVVRPTDEDAWGARFVGSDAAKVGKDVDFADIGDFCVRVADVADRKDYRDHVPWVDQVRLVQDPEERQAVRDAVVAELKAGNPSDLFALSPPEIVDWLGVSGFQVTRDRRARRRDVRIKRPDVELQHVLTSEFRADVDFDTLREEQLFVLDGDDRDAARWSLWRCLAGSIEVDGRTYVLEDGDIFETEPDFMHDLNRLVDGLPDAAVELPDCPARLHEPAYNVQAAAGDGLLLLDRKLVPPGYSTPIEVCDILSLSRNLVHVKRHFSADGLSHLFSQGLVSAEAMHQFPEFRANVAQECRDQGSVPHAALFEDERFDPSKWEVVYGIVAAWRGRAASAAIPFFSKLTLSHAATRLTRYGFAVSLKRIERLTA